jgi:hypothetical protein
MCSTYLNFHAVYSKITTKFEKGCPQNITTIEGIKNNTFVSIQTMSMKGILKYYLKKSLKILGCERTLVKYY